MQNEIRGVMTAIRRSQMLRLLLIGFLVLLLLIPAAMIGGLVSERRATREGAVEEVTAKWGRMQVVTGPALVIRVPRSSDLHTLDDGRVLVRNGSENRPLRGDEIRNLANSKATGDYEAEAVAGIRRGLEDVAQGRTQPAKRAFAELRKKHGIPRKSRA